MENLRETELRAFGLFERQWGLVTAGSIDRFNACTVSWGSLGTVWNRPAATVYLHPARYTRDVMLGSEYFTVSFFPEQYRPALQLLGSRSGRDGDKIAASGLTPVPFGAGVAFAEAERTFLCRKLYQHPFSREDLDPEIGAYYRAHPEVYPPDENGDWRPHWVFVGEITETRGA